MINARNERGLEQERMRQFEQNLQQMHAGYRGASEGVEDQGRDDTLTNIELELRRDFYASLEMPHVGDGLAWFDGSCGRMQEECERWIMPEVTQAVARLRNAILARRGHMRRGADDSVLLAAEADVISAMREVAKRADDAQLGGDVNGNYGHVLLHLMENIAMHEFGVDGAKNWDHEGVSPMVNVLFRYTNEEGLK